jgi:phosphocarrier protein HPr
MDEEGANVLETAGLRLPEGLVETSTRTVRVTHQHGLHLRPCSAIVNTVNRHRARVLVQHGNQSANAASIFDLLSLGAAAGTELVLSATGAEAEEAVEAVAELFDSGPEVALHT